MIKILKQSRISSPVHCFGVFRMYNGDLFMCSAFENFYDAQNDLDFRDMGRAHSLYFIIEGDFDVSPAFVQSKKGNN